MAQLFSSRELCDPIVFISKSDGEIAQTVIHFWDDKFADIRVRRRFCFILVFASSFCDPGRSNCQENICLFIFQIAKFSELYFRETS